MTHLNIEIKAYCSNPQRISNVLQTKGADFHGVDQQTDTYFHVPHGRLKLREGRIEKALIYYEREDREGPKLSQVSLFPLTAPSPLKAILTAALGILVVVEKQRAIYFIENVKFHVDTVTELGTFVEIEAIDKDGEIGKDKLLAQCQTFLTLFDIQAQDLIAVSYSDLLLAKRAKPT